MATHSVGSAELRAQSLASIRVGDVMHPGVVLCRPGVSLLTVAGTMAAHRIHAVVVAPEGDAADWSLVSDLDVAAAVGEGQVKSATAGQLAVTPNVSVHVDETVPRAAQLMREYDTHHLTVLADHAKRPVGILSTLDIADAVAELPLERER